MQAYKCPACQAQVSLTDDQAPTRNQPATCPQCGKNIPYPKRGEVVDYHAMQNANSGALNPLKKVKRTHTQSLATGRAPAAPTLTNWPLTQNGARAQGINRKVTHCPSLTAPPWTNAPNDELCLAYTALDSTRPGMEGLRIRCAGATNPPANDPEVLKHFATVKSQLVAAYSDPQICEATGEAAAALCILAGNSLSKGATTLTLQGFQMEWGFDLHRGTGIDQIWKRASTNDYLIVEAKGPGAVLGGSPNWAPDDFGQMEIRWVMHNIVTMSGNNQIGRDLIRDLGLTTSIRWPASSNPVQGSKNYHGVTHAVPQAQLYGVVVTAKWLPDGLLSYTSSNFQQYTDFTH